MRSILTLDLATRTGWAIGPPGSQPKHGVLVLPSTGVEIGRFAFAYHEWLDAMLSVNDVAAVSFEAPILPHRTTPATVQKLMGLAWHTEFVCHLHDVRCSQANLSSVKKFFAGTGHASVPDMMAACHRLGWQPKDDNDADALAHWAYAVHMLAPGHDERFRIGAMGMKK